MASVGLSLVRRDPLEPVEFGCAHLRASSRIGATCCNVCHGVRGGEVYFVHNGVRYYLCCSVGTCAMERNIPDILLHMDDLGPLPVEPTALRLVGHEGSD